MTREQVEEMIDEADSITDSIIEFCGKWRPRLTDDVRASLADEWVELIENAGTRLADAVEMLLHE